MVAGPKLDFVGASETIITVSFNPLNSHDAYILEWKEYPQKWETDGQKISLNAKEVPQTRNNKIQTNIEGLNPGTTYTVRLRVMTSANGEEPVSGKPSPELIIDTEAVGCTPKPNQCMIL
mmetsp:Transcript_9457/g.21050  ORF Transcript_9457/g.21050 Transcript_9457/m.21050 type:complete len:120 (+) Transcript_9457:78-437(+)|eukprot:g1557.t1 g1557   contig10:2328873-2329664(+)